MTEVINTISDARPADVSMDYERLREEGIRHLERLATDIWTDFNAHDPGITILEVLCYAITDLGYRANLPIEDLLASENGDLSDTFYHTDQVLHCHPTTATDYRKLLIDLEGVKNAWLEKALTAEMSLFVSQSITFKPISTGKVNELLEKYVPESDQTRIGDLINKLMTDAAQIGAIRNDTTDSAGYPALSDAIVCQYGYFKIITPSPTIRINGNAYKRIVLNGLYNIQLELDDSIQPNDISRINEVKSSVRARLHNNRNSCEDFLHISIVKPQYICICLNIEVASEADERQVLAEVLFRLQEFLAPTVRSYSLQQMLAKGYHCDAIFDGPLLENGFIDTQELEQANLHTKIYLSDLHRIIVETPQVEVIKEFNVKPPQNSETWCFDVNKGHKWMIDLCCSTFYVSKGAMSCKIDDSEIEEPLEILRLSYQNLMDTTTKRPPLQLGTYREDLSDYLSVQYEFPNTYGIGENGLPEQATHLRKAQSKQLQAYLLFYDQILASYLAQLGQVRDLLSVQQNAQDFPSFNSMLLEIPSFRDLITSEFSLYKITKEKIDLLEKKKKDVPKPVLDDLQTKIGKLWQSHTDFQAEIQAIDAAFWEKEKAFLMELFQQNLLADSTFIQRRRKNQVLDHLLARFGEQFAEYATQLYCGQQKINQDGADLAELKAKTNFLKQLPTLGSERGKAYNYTLLKEGKPEVWSTTNVAGLKKKIYALLGIEKTTASVFCDPDYELFLYTDETTDGLPVYQLQLLNRKIREPLLLSTQFRRKADAITLREELYKILWKKENYELVDTNGKTRVSFKNTTENSKIKQRDNNLSSRALLAPDAERIHRKILQLIDKEECTEEGFHLIEHILLRPNDKEDDFLELSFNCDETNPVKDLYSFWLTVLLPNWTERFRQQEYRHYFEQLFRREAPAHLAIRFCWLSREDMYQVEPALRNWMEAKARCTPDECNITKFANILIGLLNNMNCTCNCQTPEADDLKCKEEVLKSNNSYRKTISGATIYKA